MRVSLGIGILCIAVSSAMAQTAPRARSAQTFVMTHGRGYLGIGGVEVTPDRMKALNLKEERGVEITSVDENGPAAKAGLKAGDVVLEYNGNPVQGTVQFQRMVSETPVGRQVKIAVSRSGGPQTLTATIGERQNTFAFATPNMPPMPEMPHMPEFNFPGWEMNSNTPALGIVGEPLSNSEQLAEFFGVTDGVLVRSVRKGSAAEKAGIKAGDVITKVDDSRVSNSTDITRTLRNLRGKKTTFNVTVVRNKKEMPLSVTLD